MIFDHLSFPLCCSLYVVLRVLRIESRHGIVYGLGMIILSDFVGDRRRDLLDISQVLREAGSAIIDVCTIFSYVRSLLLRRCSLSWRMDKCS